MERPTSKCPNCGADADQIALIDRPHRPYGFPETVYNKDDREYFYRCSVCGFESAPGISLYIGLTNEYVSRDKAQHIALERWQHRETRYSMRKALFSTYPDQEEYEKARASLIEQGRIRPWD